MTPLEAAARAICRTESIRGSLKGFLRSSELDRIVARDWDNYVPAAIDAIAALREPSEAMVNAGEGETTPAGCWSVMIDAALAEPPTPRI